MDPQIVVEGTLDPRWIDPVARLCDRLHATHDIDPTARLHILSAGPDVVLEAILGDGRSALRRVRSPEELDLTVDALLVVPSVATRPEVVAARAEPPSTVAPVAPVRDASTERPWTARRGLGVELGGSLVGRMARAPLYLSAGAEAYAAIRLTHWLLGLTLRWDPFESVTGPKPPNFEMDTLGTGFLVARRFRASSIVHVDLGTTASLLVESQGAQVGAKEMNDAETDLRFGLITRLLLGRSPIRLALSLQADLSPVNLRRSFQVAPSFPNLPVWSAGLGIGTAWGES